MPRSIQEILDHADELAKRLEDYDPQPGDERPVEEYLIQRAAIARALIRNPMLLLCDEPTGNLDASIADSVADLLLDLHAAHNTILVVVTHSAALADRFPTRYRMSERRLVGA